MIYAHQSAFELEFRLGDHMKLEQFEMERMQSTWENIVKHNLSESGVHPVAIRELVTDTRDLEEMLQIELGYGQSNGTIELRNRIAALYPGASPDNILVTNGSSEANFLATWMLVEPGDEVVIMLPNYMQIWGVARGFGAEVKPFHLVEERDWAPDLDELDKAVSSKTKLIAVCNPSNPTGAILSEDDMERIVAAARSRGAWLLADEVYRGAERGGAERGGAERDESVETPSFWGRYEKVMSTNGLSKAYGLPGLRIGWMVSTPELAQKAWSYHDYTTIGPAMASDLLARIALRPEMRLKLLGRTRNIIRSNYPILKEWIDRHGDLFSVVDPKAGAIAYVRSNVRMNSLDFVTRLREEKSVLIVPGAHFRMGNYLRIGFGSSPEHLRAGLEQIDSFISELD
jgi:aspartate/methionine/tyrosine aminotransferase